MGSFGCFLGIGRLLVRQNERALGATGSELRQQQRESQQGGKRFHAAMLTRTRRLQSVRPRPADRSLQLQAGLKAGRIGHRNIIWHPTMNDNEFIQLTEAVFARIQQGLENADLDFEQPADGILEIEFDDGSKMVVNRHNTAREIWVAARSGGFHFRPEGTDWLDTRDNTELFAKLTALISAQGGGSVSFG